MCVFVEMEQRWFHSHELVLIYYSYKYTLIDEVGECAFKQLDGIWCWNAYLKSSVRSNRMNNVIIVIG